MFVQLQGSVKDLMKRNELTASLANDELVFFLVCLKLLVYVPNLNVLAW